MPTPDEGWSGPDPGGPFVVAPEAALDRRRSRLPVGLLAVAVAAVAGLTAWGLLSPPPPAPTPEPPTARPSAGASSVPASAEPAPPAGVDVALTTLAFEAGWHDCPVWRDFGRGSEVTPDRVDREAARQGTTSGPLRVDDGAGAGTTVWLNVDADAVIRGLGATIRVDEGDAVWTVAAGSDGLPMGVLYREEPLPSGGSAWIERGAATPAPYCLLEPAGEPASVIEVDRAADPLARLLVEMGLDQCRTWQRMEAVAVPAGAEVDRAADVLGLGVDAPAWILLPFEAGYGERLTRTWIGADPAVAGSRHRASTVVLQRGDPAVAGDGGTAWMAIELGGRPTAVRFRLVDTPEGRLAWLATRDAAGAIGSCVARTPGAPAGTGSDGAGDEPPGPTVELLRGGTDAMAMLTEHFDWTGCRMTGAGGFAEEPFRALTGRVVVAADAAPSAEGWLTVPRDDTGQAVRAWLGSDLVSLARAAGVTVVATDDSGAVWLADPARAAEWRAIITPAGRTAWIPTGAVTAPDAPCAGTVGAPDTIDGVRSFTCWTDRARCLEAVRAAVRVAPDAFTVGTEVSAGLGDSCPPNTRCGWVGPNMPVIVTAAPARWTSSADVRAFSAGWRRLSLPFRELPAGEIGPRVLAMASRPSRSLPVAAAGDDGAGYCPASGITGELRGSPWDPRVAWVGLSTVRWPAGFTARFTPGLELVSPEGAVYRPGDLVQASGLAGSEPVFEACRITGTSAP